MFKLNRKIKLSSGEFLTPFLVDSESVYCLTDNGKTIIKDIREFDFSGEAKAGVVMVNPVFEKTISAPVIRTIPNIPLVAPLEVIKEIIAEEIVSVIAKEEPMTVIQSKPVPKIMETLRVIKTKKPIEVPQAQEVQIGKVILNNEEYI
jgi:hypothetical protein